MLQSSIIAAVATLSATALAQGNLLSQIPQCAQTCFGNSLGSCGALDIACICGNTAVITKVSCCVFATCPESDIKATTSFATNLCSLQGIQVNTNPDCSNNGTKPIVSASSSGNATLPTATHSTSPSSGTATAAAAPFPRIGGGFGFGTIMAVLLAFL